MNGIKFPKSCKAKHSNIKQRRRKKNWNETHRKLYNNQFFVHLCVDVLDQLSNNVSTIHFFLWNCWKSPTVQSVNRRKAFLHACDFGHKFDLTAKWVQILLFLAVVAYLRSLLKRKKNKNTNINRRLSERWATLVYTFRLRPTGKILRSTKIT